MGQIDPRDPAPWLEDEPSATQIEDGAELRPFMPGIMVASLLRRGLDFADAYRATRGVAERIAGRARVDRCELASLLSERLEIAAAPGTPFDASSIFVSEGEGELLPFSKGILSQSLLATAIEPSEAFAIAHRIEHELRKQRRSEIDRQDLRKLAHDVILAQSGEKAAQRYLLWRRHQEPDQPLILLLGGTSGVGKSSLALEVARRLGIGRAVSTDSIRQMMRLMLSPELVPAIHGSSYDAWTRLPPIGERMPTVIEGFQAQAAAVSVGVRALLERTIDESSHLVIDGVSIVPGLTGARAFAKDAHVICLMIATQDESELRARLLGRASGQSRRPADRYLENLEGILEIQRHLVGVAREQGVPVIDNRRFDDSVREVLDHVMEHLAADARETRARPHPG